MAHTQDVIAVYTTKEEKRLIKEVAKGRGGMSRYLLNLALSDIQAGGLEIVSDQDEASLLYDLLYSMADFLIKKYNPCEIIDGTCLDYRINEKENFCCCNCPSLSGSGCTVKSLYCKLWLCESAIANQPELSEKLGVLWDIAESNKLLLFRGSKERSLQERIDVR